MSGYSKSSEIKSEKNFIGVFKLKTFNKFKIKSFDFELIEEYYVDCRVRKNLSTSCFQLEPSPRLSRLM